MPTLLILLAFGIAFAAFALLGAAERQRACLRSRLRAARAGDAVRLALVLSRMLAEGPWTDDAPDARPIAGDPGEASFTRSSATIHTLPPRFR